jgi:hypothetical protein
MRHDYVELNRNFLDFEDELDIEGAAWKSYYASFSGGLNWEKLLQSQYVVILGEAGSGKTWELEAQTEKLRKTGLNSFFIPIETLANQSFPSAIDSDDLEYFSKWQTGSSTGTFFLDSVDEAKLQRPKAFHDALNSFAKGIGPGAIKRAKVVITCRVSEWRGKADLYELQRRFMIPSVQVEKKRSYPGTEDPAPLLRIVQLAPLDRERVSLLASHRGVKDIEAFIKAIDSSDLWNFAGRPKDVENLITYWQENRSFGSISQMVEYDVKCKLQDTNRTTSLSFKKAVYGAQALAAAVILCRRFTFIVPDEPVDPALAATAINPIDVLTDWKPENICALLSMAIFDESTYGRVRFHHRTIAEYLAAQWIIYIQTAGCPLRSIEDMIFGQAHGSESVRPSCIPVAAWLSALNWPWNRIIMDRIIRINPDILLSYGDPQLLPLGARSLILKSMVKRYAGRRRVRVDADTAQLRRLAHDDLAPEIDGYLKDKTVSDDLRELLLRMIGNEKLTACIDAALRIVPDESETESLRYAAVFSVVENAGDEQLRQLAANIVDYKEVSQRICALLLQRMYPNIIGIREVIKLIGKAVFIPRFSVSYLPEALEDLINRIATDDDLQEVLPQFIMLIEQRPRIHIEGKETPISNRFLWLGHALYTQCFTGF